MNPFSNETQLYNHTEPILKFPDSGQCSLLTGLEKDEINANIFRPCCSEARAVGEERSTCKCEQDSCDTCFAQNAEKFKLIAATCNTSAGFRTFRVNKMVAFLFVIGTLMFQASASTIQARAPYDGPGDYLSDLAGDVRKRGEDSSSVEHAMTLLGEDTIVDCLTNTATKESDAADAVADLLEKFGTGNYTLRPNFCRSREAGKTKAEICNKSGKEVTVSLEKVQAALDLLQDTCTKDGKSGKLTDDDVSYRIYAMSAAGRPIAERRGLNKRCVNPDTPEVSGCMDDICEPKIVVNESGDCPWSGPNQDDGKGDDCGWYCEKRATKYYGVPEDYENTRFCTGGDCYLEEGEGFSFEKSISTTFELGGGGSKGPLESILGAGISFGFTWGKQEMVTQGSNFGEGKCGYWMKVPVMLHSCGVYSEYQPNFGEMVLYCLKDAPFDHTDKDACSDTIAKSINGDKGDILVVPRWHDCKSRKELPMEEQSEQWKNLFDGSLGDPDC